MDESIGTKDTFLEAKYYLNVIPILVIFDHHSDIIAVTFVQNLYG